MLFGQEAIESTPSTKIRRRLSANPLITGRFEIPPALCTLIPGMLVKIVAVSLVAACLLSISLRPRLADLPSVLASDALAVTIIAGR